MFLLLLSELRINIYYFVAIEWNRFCLSCLLVLLLQNFKLFGFSIFRFWVYLMKVILSAPDEGYFECTWWWLFWVHLMKVILSVPDEGYFECTWWRLFWVYLMKVILSVPDEGYFECTWWRLFWVYLMKVILSVPDEGDFEWNLH
jgi:hypothetical protein